MSKETVAGCPFCGDTPTVEELHGGHDKHIVACRNATCNATPTVIGATRADAIRRWNTRETKTQDVVPDGWIDMLHLLAESFRLLVAAIEQITASCQTREQRISLVIGHAVLEAFQRLEHADHAESDGDTTAGGGDQ